MKFLLNNKFMYNYFVGDIHGCYRELRCILSKARFNFKQDFLWITGDLVNRGPDSLKVLFYVKKLGLSAKMVLGNHDINFIIKYVKYIKENKKIDKNIVMLINWLRNQPILRIDNEKKIIMTHAGFSPQFDINTIQFCAKEIEYILKSSMYVYLSDFVYQDLFNVFSLDLDFFSRVCFGINALTRMRYCFSNGNLNIDKNNIYKDIKYCKPWFNFKLKIPKDYSIIFGHWSSINGQGTPKNIYGLDTGCCWGRKLTLLRWEDKKYFTQNSFSKKKYF